jgi:peptidoglycan L-alanyl-D-glutamate endopeptidase CwlK
VINSRNLNDLCLQARKRVDALRFLCQQANIDILITSTYRDNESQDALYAQGRTTPGAIVTHAKGGESFHNYRCAVDVVPVVNGKPVWDTENPIWQQIGALGKKCGLEWAGLWTGFKEFPHFQYTGGLSIEDLKAGKQIP